ncbi:hypothetical protein IL306_003202, partial [Fusarium sp. DS 682]
LRSSASRGKEQQKQDRQNTELAEIEWLLCGAYRFLDLLFQVAANERTERRRRRYLVHLPIQLRVKLHPGGPLVHETEDVAVRAERAAGLDAPHLPVRLASLEMEAPCEEADQEAQ